MNNPKSFGCVPNDPDDRDYILIDTLERLEQELTKLQQQGIQVGIWKPNRDQHGEPTNYELDISPVKVVKSRQFSDEDIIVPLKPSVESEVGTKTIKVDLPEHYSLYKGGDLKKALAFNGKDSYLEIPKDANKFFLDSINFEKNQDFTIALWIKANSRQVDVRDNFNSIIEKWDGNSKHSTHGYPYAIRYDNSVGKIVCSRFDGGHNQPQVSSKTAIDDGEFHHIAFVKNGYDLYLYIDGELEDRSLDTTQDNNSSEHCTENESNFYIGYRGSKTNYFKGQLSGIRIWKQALKEEDIQTDVKNMITQKTNDETKGEINQKYLDKLLDSNFSLSETDWKDIITYTINELNQGEQLLNSNSSNNISQAIAQKYVIDLEIINNYFDPEFKSIFKKEIPNNQDIDNLSGPLLPSEETDKQIKTRSEKIKNTAKIINRQIIKTILGKGINGCSYNLKLVNFENWSPVKTQGELASCTAHAAVALLEYFERKASGIYEDYSIFFLYQAALHLSNKYQIALELNNDNKQDNEIIEIIKEGISIREVMAAIIAFGVPPEKYWRYPQDTELRKDISKKVRNHPNAFVYTLAQKYKAKSYFCLNRAGMKNRLDVLEQIKIFIYAGFPPMFGFRLYPSAISHSESNKGEIPFPNFITTHKHDGVNSNATYNNHALVAVGYDDSLKIETDFTHQTDKQIENSINNIRRKYGEKFILIEHDKIITTGALRIRNSYGQKWGENGYGWLPYAYVLAEIKEEGEEEASHLTFDWWSMLKAEWFDTDYFGISTDDRRVGYDHPVFTGKPK